MRIKVKITFRDNTSENHECVDWPNNGSSYFWLNKGDTGIHISHDGISRVEATIVAEKIK